jgi:hypothetical protein
VPIDHTRTIKTIAAKNRTAGTSESSGRETAVVKGLFLIIRSRLWGQVNVSFPDGDSARRMFLWGGRSMSDGWSWNIQLTWLMRFVLSIPATQNFLGILVYLPP